MGGLEALKKRRRFVGQINGIGFMLGIDLVQNKVSREPAPKLASWLLSKMREKRILLTKEGEHKNMIAVMPTLCFSKENATQLLQMLEEVDDEDRWPSTSGEETNAYEDMD